MLRRTIPPAFFLLATLASVAQQNDIPLNRDIYLDVEHNAACRTSSTHDGLKPLIESRAELSHVLGFRPDTTKHYYWITEKLFKEHLVQLREGDFRLFIDPVFHFELGQDFRDPSEFADTTRFYVNSRGLRVAADLGPRISFQTSFYENQAIYPQYIYQYATEIGVVPGMGRIKGFKNRAFDFAWAGGNVSWSPRGWLNLQFGHGKHFVGHGYRSVLLSDVAFNYPYFKFSLRTNDGRLQYSTIYAKLMHGVLEEDRLPTGDGSESLFYWKRATFHHLSLNLGPAQVGLFESTIWKTIERVDEDPNDDVHPGVLPFNALSMNPVIGVNTAVNGFASEHETLIGLDLKVKLTDKFFVYGQIATDDPARSRMAWQAGLRSFDLFRSDLHVQLEYNAATPYMYMQQPDLVNYGHYGQPLAHPAGAYFNEAIAIVDYRVKRFLFQAKVNILDRQTDVADSLHYGGNIYKPDEETVGGPGPLLRTTSMLDLNASWLMNQMTNMRVQAGVVMRDETNAPDFLGSTYVYIAWRTGLFNRYFDL